jgi:lipopolysaccharide exporter
VRFPRPRPMTEPDRSLQGRVLRGAGWALAMRWAVRGIGLVSTIILARLLMPEDFGIVAMAMIAVGFSDILFDFGVAVYLIRKPDATDEDFHAAWSLRVLQGLAATGLLLFSTPFAVDYFGEPRLQPVLLSLAWMPLLSGLENIGIVQFQKRLELHRDFRFFVYKKLGAFVLTLTLAVTLRDYWALVAGSLGGATLGVLLSYRMHGFRPRFHLTHARSMLSFSTWLLLRNVGLYAQTRLDRLIVGERFGSTGLGIYTVASEISEVPTSELLAPMGRALLPGLSMIQQDRERLRRAFHKAFGVVAATVIPAGLGLALVAEPVVLVFLGEKWRPVVGPLQFLALTGMTAALSYVPAVMLTALGHVRVLTLMIWAQLATFLVLVLLLFPGGSLTSIAAIRFALGALVTVLIFGQTLLVGVVSVGDLVVGMVRPLIAAAAMGVALLSLDPYLHWPPLLKLPAEVATGSVCYTTVLFLAWQFAKRPPGAESLVWEAAGRLRSRHKRLGP